MSEETAEITRKRFPSRKHEQSIAGSAKSRTQARVVTQAAPSHADSTPSKKSGSKKHSPTSGGDGR
jgi:hypothetical protein